MLTLSWGLVLDYRLIGVIGLLLTVLRSVLRRRAAHRQEGAQP